MNTTTIAAGTSAPAPDDLSQQIEALRADLAKLATTLSDEMTEGLGNTGRRIGRAGRDAGDTAARTVIEHPMTAVGIAAVLGLLAGMFVRRA